MAHGGSSAPSSPRSARPTYVQPHSARSRLTAAGGKGSAGEDFSLLLSPRPQRDEGSRKIFRKGFGKNKKSSLKVPKGASTPLHQICKDGNIVQLTALLKKSPECVNKVDKATGYSPLLVALCMNNLEVASELIKFHADTSYVAPDGTSTLHALMAVTDKRIDLFYNILRKLQVDDPNIADHDGETPLHRAVLVGNEAGILFLRSKKADVNAQNKRGETPLHVAARSGESKLIDLLISMGADASIEGDRGPPASVAKRSGHKSIASMLKEKALQGPVKVESSAAPVTSRTLVSVNQKKAHTQAVESGLLHLDFGGLERLFSARAHTAAVGEYIASGSVFLQGLMYLTNSASIQKHLALIASKKLKGNLLRSAEHSYISRLQAVGVAASRVRDLSDNAHCLSCADNTVAVIDQGEVYMSGAAEVHHLILGKSGPDEEQGRGKFSLVPVPFPVKKVVNGPFHSLALTTNNRVYGWGSNLVMASTLPEKDGLDAGAPGLLARGKELVMSGPIELCGFSGDVVDIACSDTHSVVLTSEGCYTCGQGGVVGRDDSAASLLPIHIKHHVAYVSCGRGFTLLCDTFGIVLGFGNNHYGQLGAGKTLPFVVRPTPIAGFKEARVRRVSCGMNHSAAIDDKDRLWTWGANKYGALGHSKGKECVYLPIQLDLSPPAPVATVCCGSFVTSCTTRDGDAHVWGRLASETLATHQLVPRRVEEFRDMNVFVAQAECSSTLTAFRSDRVLTDVLQVLCKFCRNEDSYKPSFIREMLASIPESMISVVQDRALAFISQPYPEPLIRVCHRTPPIFYFNLIIFC
eukprot:TRINITY_DN6957_c0_g1_i2.p1 TRINITY_DN6957_c0_g1~~TRINITY_DN6957_c0_g1_i2.p1  ORF type:complete len:923 (-),score=250.99 TRINITY_DN6957_c0_g1_i2:58-2484(-)